MTAAKIDDGGYEDILHVLRKHTNTHGHTQGQRQERKSRNLGMRMSYGKNNYT